MLEMIEGRTEKKQAQLKLVKLLAKVWRVKETRLVAWRPSSTELQIQHNGEHWFGTAEVGKNDGVYRHWNCFGVYKATGTLGISVEINIPIVDNSGLVSGFFARDSSSGNIYVMHDGGVGGGRKGIGRDAFLSATHARPMVVKTSNGMRSGLIVAPLEARNFEAGISAYLAKVVSFKASPLEGISLKAAHGLPKGIGYSEYFKEFAGTKNGGGTRFVYESRHGDIVHALTVWASAHDLVGEIRKSVLVDLAIRRKGKTIAVFEVKSSIDRQSIYTGIGQLMVHSARAECARRYLVIPMGEIPEDIRVCLVALSVQILRYQLIGRDVIFRG
jgi:hypothetical protein